MSKMKSAACNIVQRKIVEEPSKFFSSKHTEYDINVSDGIYHWNVTKRYSEFYQLNETLRKTFPFVQLKLPPKKTFKNTDPEFLNERQMGLQEFINNLVQHRGLAKR
ncbi:sorting nexin-16-like [Glandiceps talaboti]